MGSWLEGVPPDAPPDTPPGQRVELWAYRPDFRSSNRLAPPFPDALRADLVGGEDVASEVQEEDGRPWIQVGVRMPWPDGPAALVLVREPLPPEMADRGLIAWGLLVLCLALLAATWLAAGPIVRRIRRLQAGVRQAAATRYATEVEVKGHDEIADLARAFNEAGRDVRRHLSDVEERERTLRAFVANTTHDVMIPLTVLQGHLAECRDLLSREAAAGGPAPAGLRVAGEGKGPAGEGRATAREGDGVDGEGEVLRHAGETLRASLEEAHYLASLLHNLSAVAKLEAGEPERHVEPVDLNRLVERVVERHRPIARGRSIEVEYAVPERPVVVEGDVTLLEQAVSNVVHNAVRYHREGGHVGVILEQAAGRFTLEVLDDGPGVTPEDLARLTERRFRAAEARTRAPGGLGLGLHIARDVADRHGFSLTFRPREPHGLSATFAGPAALAGPSA